MTRAKPNTQPNPQSNSTPSQPRSRAGRLAWMLDNQFQIPGTSVRVGLDGILGLIPGIGDTISSGLSLLILAEAVQSHVSRRTLAKMAGNIALDWVIGLVPVAGDVFDIIYKANMRNLALLEADLAARESPGPSRNPAANVRRVENLAR